MKTLKIIVCFVLMGLGMSACDSFLTTPPLDQISEGQWWQNKEQVEMMVKGAYQYIYDVNEIVLRDCMSDNATHREKYKDVANGTYTTQSSAVKDEWKYSAIAHLNYVLEGLEKSKGNISEDEYRRFNAEVRFIRATIYYDMAFFFGDVPLITKTLSVAESRETSRQPRQEVIDFVFRELEEEVLPNINAIEVSESGRINEQVVNAYLSRICLFEKKYDKVLAYTDKVIKSGKYELYSDYEGLFRPQSDETNKEVIFERQYSSPLYVHTLNRDLSPASSIYGGWSHVLPLQELVDEYECINGHKVSECESLGCEYYQKRKDAETEIHRGEYDFRDPRLGATIMWPFWEWKVGGKVQSRYGVDDPNSPDYVKQETFMTGYLITKWVDLEGAYDDRTRSGKNLTILRYADVLLMRAEALIELDQNLDEAVSLINQVRFRVNMPGIKLGLQNELREKLRHERRIETAFEGLRYFDIIRWRIADKVKSGKVYGARLKAVSETMENKFVEERIWDDKMFLFPVPQEARDNNPNLTQNKGW